MSTVSIINAIFDSTKKQTFPEHAKPLILILRSFMGINQLTLSDEILAALYPETLVNPSQPVLSISVCPFMGKNKRGICFLVANPNHEFLSDHQLTFLKKILAACKLDLDDIALINIARNNFNLDLLKSQFDAKLVFIWGEHSLLPEKINGFRELEISHFDGIKFVPVRTADQMDQDTSSSREQKQKLWSFLKTYFAL
jgi:hypothetical protein